MRLADKGRRLDERSLSVEAVNDLLHDGAVVAEDHDPRLAGLARSLVDVLLGGGEVVETHRPELLHLGVADVACSGAEGANLADDLLELGLVDERLGSRRLDVLEAVVELGEALHDEVLHRPRHRTEALGHGVEASVGRVASRERLDLAERHLADVRREELGSAFEDAAGGEERLDVDLHESTPAVADRGENVAERKDVEVVGLVVNVLANVERLVGANLNVADLARREEVSYGTVETLRREHQPTWRLSMTS